MTVFKRLTESGHKELLFFQSTAGNLKAIIALHDTSLGITMGGTRLFPYPTEEEALRDVLRLSLGMTYKAACAQIPVGGAKAVIIADPRSKTGELFEEYGRFVEELNGRFVTGQDVNIQPEDVLSMQKQTRFVVGTVGLGGGPAPATAEGLVQAMSVAVTKGLGCPGLRGLKIAIQGCGSVAENLCRLLSLQGAELFVSDIDAAKVKRIVDLYGATPVATNEIHKLPVDVFAPCAMGGILNDDTIPDIKAKAVVGAANNQLGEEGHQRALCDRRILYIPDYVANAGGLINVYNEMIGRSEKEMWKHVFGIAATTSDILDLAMKNSITPFEASKTVATARLHEFRHMKRLSSTKKNLGIA
ncbi:MAG TPA: Glu/Leu/Phe/Val dehydrogenase dimerization domain-containing protein [Oligoflexus sp.]|uniref:Leu/Phe/Val dehydrogenase n=1 Tax=Oligoflexus sp. TaxID=1971216 RepID=UPI002D72BBB1|nr:Glu/Leu/Phe/Val dehydrogenase dimerization domain-containing protein [Oligoflexus sp.]HYX39096.1 Glu/Leu/Phe/Val dehydrogenase dimerization domain-containing protein [Oligoflexus sp.]